ncbi:MAG: CBS domain-containing protein [Desulfomonile tiedjei]|nr:CBS domain-containing protein [Desulfomonile tiedjei]
MLVKYWMRRTVVTADIDDSMQEGINRVKEHNLSLLPILQDGHLVGIVTDRDIKRASASDATALEVHELLYLLSTIRLGSIMTKDPVTIPADYTLEEAAQLLLKNQISGAPVVDSHGTIVGTIGQREIFSALVALTGLEKRGIQFAFQVEDRPGSIKEVTDVIRRYNGRLASILTSYERAPSGFRHVYVRAYQVDRGKLQELIDNLRKQVVILYMVDLRDNKRVEYVESYRVA